MKPPSFSLSYLAPRATGALRALALAAATLVVLPAARAGASAAIVPPATDVATVESGVQTAVFAGGCFWGVQGVFQHVAGVKNVVSGYTGGSAETANYERVESGRTGHAEAVRIVFDPAKVSYGRLLHIYFSVAHDPTQLNRQGPDQGPQYRSAVFTSGAEQSRVARAYIGQLNQSRAFGKDLATTVEPGRTFYPAEAYHQDYMVRNPANPYVRINELPKIENLKRLFPQAYQATPVLVSAAPKSA